jgi:hypothetical protein
MEYIRIFKVMKKVFCILLTLSSIFLNSIPDTVKKSSLKESSSGTFAFPETSIFGLSVNISLIPAVIFTLKKY